MWSLGRDSRHPHFTAYLRKYDESSAHNNPDAISSETPNAANTIPGMNLRHPHFAAYPRKRNESSLHSNLDKISSETSDTANK